MRRERGELVVFLVNRPHVRGGAVQVAVVAVGERERDPPDGEEGVALDLPVHLGIAAAEDLAALAAQPEHLPLPGLLQGVRHPRLLRVRLGDERRGDAEQPLFRRGEPAEPQVECCLHGELQPAGRVTVRHAPLMGEQRALCLGDLAEPGLVDRERHQRLPLVVRRPGEQANPAETLRQLDGLGRRVVVVQRPAAFVQHLAGSGRRQACHLAERRPGQGDACPPDLVGLGAEHRDGKRGLAGQVSGELKAQRDRRLAVVALQGGDALLEPAQQVPVDLARVGPPAGEPDQRLGPHQRPVGRDIEGQLVLPVGRGDRAALIERVAERQVQAGSHRQIPRSAHDAGPRPCLGRLAARPLGPGRREEGARRLLR